MSYRVFLSHAWADRWLAEQIAGRIERCGAAVFLDVFDIKKGDDIEDRIFEAIRNVEELLVLLTPWLWTEIGFGWKSGQRAYLIGVLCLFYIKRLWKAWMREAVRPS